ncbi:MAG: 50S ribosomal protein L24 [Bacteroidetes bacterium]|nr:50S ribosomal protein L24 [Rhodothermaceae bacterium RA]RMH67006.1 MAG: 50S ribosomal protein L24 [Bacteroidota bacterium]
MPRTSNKQNKLHVRKGDMVRVIAGNDRGKEGKVLRVYPRKQRVIVEGVNMRIRHRKPTPALPQGGRVEQEAPIHVSNVMPLDGDGNPTRVGRKWIEDPETGRGHWIRYAKTTGQELD